MIRSTPVRTAHAEARPWVVYSAVMLGLFALYMGIYLAVTLGRGTEYPFGDFFALWSYAKVAATQSAATLYDHAALHAAQVSMGMEAADQNPFPYPPDFILMLRPLAVFGYWEALTLWLGTTFGLYAVAMLGGRRLRPVLALAAALAPSTTITMVAGQGGFLAAGLLIGSMRLSRRWPVAGGFMLGLLTYKPQFGLLVPVALVAAGSWRCVAAAAGTAVVLAAVVSASFGWSIWATWIDSLPAYQAMFARTGASQPLLATVTSDVEAVGGPVWLAQAVQGSTAVVAAGLVWMAYRRGPPALAIVVLLAGTCLATPHALVYDLPILTGAVYLFVTYCIGTARPLDPVEVVAVTATLIMPIVLAWTQRHVPVCLVVEASFMAVVLRRWRWQMRAG